MLGTSCVVSALAGLADVIVDAQSVLLDAALKARVPRFIPSNFSIDFTKLQAGENRNLDLRRDFDKRLDQAPIAATTIFNGAFAELLTNQMPLIPLDLSESSLGVAPTSAWTSPRSITQPHSRPAQRSIRPPLAFCVVGDQLSARELAAVVR